MRNLVFVLGDQLDRRSSALEGFDPRHDRVLMAEVPDESTHVPSHKARSALFLAAMRHYAAWLVTQGIPFDYLALGEHRHASLADALQSAIQRHAPERVIMIEPGDYRVRETIRASCRASQVELVVCEDRHFLISTTEFQARAKKYKQPRMEVFYRHMRKRLKVLMEGDDPVGGTWNYDRENRLPFAKTGPVNVPKPLTFSPDAITHTAIAAVEKHFGHHPGSLAHFGWPVTPEQAEQLLDHFIEERLPQFGRYQDAMWAGETTLYHALISSALNLKLLDPRNVIQKAQYAYKLGHAPIASVEGFIRQVLGWREFMRGMYWLDMPGMREANYFRHQRALPAWYWTAVTQMNCMRECVGQTLTLGYAHHIQRLMVTGQFALLAEVEPRQIEDWYLAMYVDAVEWAELPNVAGMALYANGGRLSSKPYIASGMYIKRMSNYCAGCRYKPEQKTGAGACPVTTLYWRFLVKNEKKLAGNPRTALAARNVARLTPAERKSITQWGNSLLDDIDQL